MTATEFELLLRKVLGEGIQLSPTVYLLLGFLLLIGSGLGAYLGAYLRKRAENLATKDDFELILEEQRRQTRETELIKEDIARAGWIHQRRWDLKHDLYSQLLQVLEEIKQKGRWLLRSLEGFWSPNPDAERVIEVFAKHMYERGILDKLIGQKAVAGLVLTDTSAASLERLTADYNDIAELVLRTDRPAEAFFTYGLVRFDALMNQTEQVHSLILAESRRDLVDQTA